MLYRNPLRSFSDTVRSTLPRLYQEQRSTVLQSLFDSSQAMRSIKLLIYIQRAAPSHGMLERLLYCPGVGREGVEWGERSPLNSESVKMAHIPVENIGTLGAFVMCILLPKNAILRTKIHVKKSHVVVFPSLS